MEHDRLLQDITLLIGLETDILYSKNPDQVIYRVVWFITTQTAFVLHCG
jgi:hypothetical protein